ncbi:unnamed protein product [Gongylonema pulchrum]|uniref:Uncharacterized protein n=1 Tax=Gongylonema pulchrum TaxID=637853 RepID=A0A183EPW6_9BILA|nr:unnamed protein product [Gongylonema pulchrum]
MNSSDDDTRKRTLPEGIRVFSMDILESICSGASVHTIDVSKLRLIFSELLPFQSSVRIGVRICLGVQASTPKPH